MVWAHCGRLMLRRGAFWHRKSGCPQTRVSKVMGPSGGKIYRSRHTLLGCTGANHCDHYMILPPPRHRGIVNAGYCENSGLLSNNGDAFGPKETIHAPSGNELGQIADVLDARCPRRHGRCVAPRIRPPDTLPGPLAHRFRFAELETLGWVGPQGFARIQQRCRIRFALKQRVARHDDIKTMREPQYCRSDNASCESNSVTTAILAPMSPNCASPLCMP